MTAAEKFAARHFVRLGLRRSEEFGGTFSGTFSECSSLSLQPASPIVKNTGTETVSKPFYRDLFRPSLFLLIRQRDF